MKAKSRYSLWMVHLLLIVGALFMVIPFLWMIFTSLKTLGESTQIPIVIFPKVPNWQNYSDVTTMLPFLKFYSNTVIVTIVKTVGQLIFCSVSAYAFARIEFPFKNIIFILCLSVLMVPSQVYMLPQFLIMRDFGWLNSLKALIVPGLFSAFGMFLLRQFFMTLPNELEEAAKLDGCNHFQIYRRIMLPLTSSGLISVAIFTCLATWNDLMWPMIVNSSPEKMTLSVGLSSLQGQFGTNFPVLMAGSLLALWPMIALFIASQKYFVEGISFTGTK
ncbi:carbohydrate ABC transporter permease [Paenibacillus sp. N3.4]|uniref:carbohydrate ABC transporter permease n=1 Tax=Paenibacillus sp. N3.4 TaxID=2603222 RepID=UPI0011CCD79A|nr:carbohydrate ABC transporter permease [Paenibacillus sp. N3.4]TXK85045.1 carbohydrate ABC transporter permease [Paenibacillus sp. N3.4]